MMRQEACFAVDRIKESGLLFFAFGSSTYSAHRLGGLECPSEVAKAEACATLWALRRAVPRWSIWLRKRPHGRFWRMHRGSW